MHLSVISISALPFCTYISELHSFFFFSWAAFLSSVRTGLHRNKHVFTNVMFICTCELHLVIMIAHCFVQQRAFKTRSEYIKILEIWKSSFGWVLRAETWRFHFCFCVLRQRFSKFLALGLLYTLQTYWAPQRAFVQVIISVNIYHVRNQTWENLKMLRILK